MKTQPTIMYRPPYRLDFIEVDVDDVRVKDDPAYAEMIEQAWKVWGSQTEGQKIAAWMYTEVMEKRSLRAYDDLAKKIDEAIHEARSQTDGAATLHQVSKNNLPIV